VPDLVLVPQKPDLYRRAHNALLSEIETVIPIDTAKSIDELTCRLDGAGRADPHSLAAAIKATIAENVGPWITCSIGFAANRQLAKIACKEGKRNGGRYGDGLAIWGPEDMPAPLLAVAMEDIPGVGGNMAKRLYRSAICTTELLLNDDRTRRRWESASNAIDNLNTRYAGTVFSLGPWRPPVGGHVGGKISYTRIPSAEDFW